MQHSSDDMRYLHDPTALPHLILECDEQAPACHQVSLCTFIVYLTVWGVEPVVTHQTSWLESTGVYGVRLAVRVRMTAIMQAGMQAERPDDAALLQAHNMSIMYCVYEDQDASCPECRPTHGGCKKYHILRDGFVSSQGLADTEKSNIAKARCGASRSHTC